MSENHPAVSPQLQSEETQALPYALTRLHVCVVDGVGLANYPPALLRDDVRLVLAEVARLREVLDGPAPEGETLIMSGPDGDGDYMATFSDYPTLSAFGSTPQLAIRELLIVLRGAFDAEQDIVATLEAEVARLREALIRWHEANGSMGFASADEDLAALAAALATPAGEGRDG